MVVGFASGEVPRIPLNLVLLKGVRILGFENRTIIEHLPDIGPNHRKEAFRLFAEGKLKPRVSAVYPLEQAGLAIADITERRVVGKVVIAVRAK